ncbi:hypothetical protein Tco_1252489 [Tanacetum coccineum]
MAGRLLFNCVMSFPAIVFDNTLTSDTALMCASTVSPNKNKIDFRISLDESEDKDYTVIFNKNSFSYKIISVNDLKKDSENDEILKPSSSELTVNLDYIKDFKNEFPAIVYNDGLTSKLDLEIEPPRLRLRMDNPNITIEEYIRLQKEKALSRGETFNWQTATYSKMEYYEDEDDYFTNFETKFPAIVLDNTLTSDAEISCGSTVSPLNDNEIDFRILFDEFDDEDYTVVYDENSFSYKIIYVNNLKMDYENDNDKVNMPSFPLPEPEVSYNDLDFFKDFENEFPAIVYNDALTSKLDLVTEPTISPRHIDEFDLKDETSLSECDEYEQNVLFFNDLFPFNVIYPDDLKLDTDNNNKIDIERSSGDMSITPIPDVINVNAQGSNKISETSHDTSNKFFKTETFIKKLNVNVMAWNYLNNGMLLKNLYVPFGIPFDPKLFYKDEINLGQV